MEPILIHEALLRIEQAKDPVDALRNEVLQHGGFWDDDAVLAEGKLFTINLHGIQAAGLGVTAALQSWCDQVRAAVDEAALPSDQGLATNTIPLRNL